MTKLNGCEFFKCDSCGLLKRVVDRQVVKVAYTVFDGDSIKSLQYHIYHVQLCPNCYLEKGKEEGEGK